MKKQSSFFIIFCLSVTLAFMSVYNLFVGYFNGAKGYEIQLSQLKKQVEKEQLRNSLLVYQINDLQQSVAQVIPESKKIQPNSDLQHLSSVLRVPASESHLDLSSVLYERGMKYFNSRSYEKAIEQFHELVEKYPLSKHDVEARFFIAESNFLKKDFKICLEAIEIMITQYPDNELTGFILLRMGQISEFNNQSEEAKEIYKVVMKNFSSEKLQEQAQQLYQGVQ